MGRFFSYRHCGGTHNSGLAISVGALKDIGMQIGKVNEEMIRPGDTVLGVMGGPELDSGTASEIGFAAALGKKCYGLRTDFRNSEDFDGIPVNLQVLCWIESSGGRLFRRIEEIRFSGPHHEETYDLPTTVLNLKAANPVSLCNTK